MSDFKVGDVVNFKSGSPDMTVMKVCPATKAEPTQPGSVGTPELIETAWFDRNGCIMRGSFPPDTLNLEGANKPKADLKPAASDEPKGDVKP